MDVILREDVEKLGRSGEVVTVKDGYARNFLLPRGLAYLATDGNAAGSRPSTSSATAASRPRPAPRATWPPSCRPCPCRSR